jgi:flagellar hook-associated protein 2
MSELGFSSSGTLRVFMQDEDGNEVTKDISVIASSTVDDVISGLKEAGLNASFDSKNGRIFLSSKSTGAIGNFSVKQVGENGRSSESGSLLTALGLSTSDDTAVTDTAASDNIMSALGNSSSGNLFEALGLNASNGATVTGSSTMSGLGFTGESGVLLVNPAGGSGTVTVKFDGTTTVDGLRDQLVAQGYTVDVDSSGRIALKDSAGQDVSFQMQGFGRSAADAVDSAADAGTSNSTYNDRKAVKIEGSDATIVLNGVVYTGSSNYFNINGFGITVSGITDYINDEDGNVDLSKVSTLKDDTAVTLSTSVDAQGIYDSMKDFLTSYNNIINEITKLYNADSASDYEPLTDDEKSEMSDTEIANWETKIKDSLLRKDTNLSTLMSAMKNVMAQTLEINGTKYALSSFGISTLSYGSAATNEESAYHIDGDEDDENTASNTDKLLAAINENPEDVVDFMKQLATNLYSAIDQQMQSTTLRSRYCIYNDKEMATQYSNYTTTISDWETKVSEKEDYYYEKFTNMETALSNLQSQTSALSGLLGS